MKDMSMNPGYIERFGFSRNTPDRITETTLVMNHHHVKTREYFV